MGAFGIFLSLFSSLLNAIALMIIKITFIAIPFAKSADMTFWKFLSHPILAWIFLKLESPEKEEEIKTLVDDATEKSEGQGR